MRKGRYMKPIVNDFSGKLPGMGEIPPLEPGDRLTRDEFERRYEAMPNLKKAELIEGIVYMPSPVRMYRHGQPQAAMVTWLGNYQAATPGTASGDNTTARLDLDNEPQPDALLIIEPRAGGQTKILEDDYIEGAPELIAEISASTVSFDLHTKFNVYRRCGVKEYVVWRVLDRAIDWLVLAAGAYERHNVDADGLLKSVTFPGLWLNAEAMIQLDLARVLADLQRGIAGHEHAEFVKRLGTRG
jgi:Uma2 family endonuclease